MLWERPLTARLAGGTIVSSCNSRSAEHSPWPMQGTGRSPTRMCLLARRVRRALCGPPITGRQVLREP